MYDIGVKEVKGVKTNVGCQSFFLFCFFLLFVY